MRLDGTREGLVVFTKRADGNSVDGAVAGKNDAGAYKESLSIVYDDASKVLTWNEKLANGVNIAGKRLDQSHHNSIRRGSIKAKARLFSYIGHDYHRCTYVHGH